MSETKKNSSATGKDSSSDTGTKAEKSGNDSTKDSDDGAKAKKSDGNDSASSSSKPNGASDVYYGKFSNVKNPAYRGGWDDIWGNGDSRRKTPTRTKPIKKKPAPVTLGLDFTDLPKPLRNGLAKFARDELKRQKSRLSYDKHDKAGSVDWRIEFRIDP
jgi:hypothetical protein